MTEQEKCEHNTINADLKCSDCGVDYDPETMGQKEPLRLTAKEAAQFIDDWESGRIYTSVHCGVENAKMVFMNFAMCLPIMSESFLRHTAILYESVDKAAPMAVNGMPSFFSCKFMHIDDWEKILPILIEKEKSKEQERNQVIENW